MQGIRKEVATLIKREQPAVSSVHCFAHSLNLCLQDLGRNLELSREAFKLIELSPKQSHLFSIGKWWYCWLKSSEPNQMDGLNCSSRCHYKRLPCPT